MVKLRCLSLAAGLAAGWDAGLGLLKFLVSILLFHNCSLSFLFVYQTRQTTGLNQHLIQLFARDLSSPTLCELICHLSFVQRQVTSRLIDGGNINVNWTGSLYSVSRKELQTIYKVVGQNNRLKQAIGKTEPPIRSRENWFRCLSGHSCGCQKSTELLCEQLKMS
jgi:hypothetical protein